MTTTADSAVTGTAPHRIVWRTGVGICISGAVGLAVLITVGVSTGGEYDQTSMDFARAVVITLIVSGLVISGAAWNACLRQREAAVRQQAQEDSEGWHGEQFRTLGDELRQVRQVVAIASLDGGTSDMAARVAEEVRTELSDEIARAVRSAHAAGYIAGVSARQAAAVNGMNGTSGGHLRLIDPENPS